MSEFVSKCPYCGTELILDEEWIGRNAQCFSCDNKFHIAKPNDDAKENIISGTDELNKSTDNKDLV